MSVQIGNVYLLGPIKSTLRPRIIAPCHLKQLRVYARDIWRDAVKLEKLWMKGQLAGYVQISREEEEIARLSPWKGCPAIIASDGLFDFGGGLR